MRLAIDKLGEFGLVNDVNPQDIPNNAWSRVENVRFDLGMAKHVCGYDTLFTPSGTARYLVGVDVSGAWNIVYPTDDAIYTYIGGTEIDISRTAPYTGNELWSGCILNGVVVLNNPNDCPQVWSGTGDCTDLIYSGSNTWDAYDGGSGLYRAKVIRSYRNFLIALGISESGEDYPYLVHWSSPADPGTTPMSWDWTDPSTMSGRADLADTAGYVVDAMPLKDSLVIYKEDATWVATYTGGEFQFRFDKLSESKGYGIYAKDCVADIGGKHVVLGQNVVYLHDGVRVQDILKGRAAEALFASINPEYYYLTFVYHCAQTSEVVVCYPGVGSTICDKAYVYNYRDNVWSWRQIPPCYFASQQILSVVETRSWPSDSSGGGWNRDLTESWDERSYSPKADTIVTAGSVLYSFGAASTTYGGTNPVSILERTGLRLGQGGQVSLLRAIYPRIQQGVVSVQVGSQYKIDDQIRWSAAQSFNPATDVKLDFTQAAVFHAVRFRVEDGSRWRLTGYELDIESIGEY